MKPLEAVARAIAAGLKKDYDAAFPSPTEWNEALRKGRLEPGQDINALFQREYQEIARAAITALRDAGVTEGMIVACTEVWSEFQDNETGEQVLAEFRAMLDAVLNEAP